MKGNKVNADELRIMLHEGNVHFQFVKSNGELREATGTTLLDNVPSDSHPKGVRDSSSNVIVFFDLDKGEWRSVKRDSEIYILD